MKRSRTSQTDITKKAINRAKKTIKELKEKNQSMTWQQRNEVTNAIANDYKENEFFQSILYGDSVCKWWRKNFD